MLPEVIRIVDHANPNDLSWRYLVDMKSYEKIEPESRNLGTKHNRIYIYSADRCFPSHALILPGSQADAIGRTTELYRLEFERRFLQLLELSELSGTLKFPINEIIQRFLDAPLDDNYRIHRELSNRILSATENLRRNK